MVINRYYRATNMVFRKIVDVLEIRAKSDMLSLVTSVARRKPCERSWI